MSYAEHGSRIFYNNRLNYNSVSKNDDDVTPRKRSEGRLKLFGSCTDLRAWSPNSLDNCRYFREIVENPLPRGKIVPYDVIIESLIILGTQTQRELVSLRRQLENYKSLRLSPEQKKQLQDIDGYYLDDRNKSQDSLSIQESKFIDEENAVPERPGTPEHSICSSGSNYESESIHRSRIDDESSSEYHFDDHKHCASSKTDSTEYVDLSEESLVRANSHQAIVIQKDSEIIALKNDLAAKVLELEELKDLNQNLETILRDNKATLNNWRGRVDLSQQKIQALSKQLQQEMEESKKKLYASKCLVDHLKTNLAEKSQECSERSRQIDQLQERLKETDRIREDRDCLVRALEELEGERKALRELNQEQAMHLKDQDDEINRLLEVVKVKAAEHSERETKMKKMLNGLRTEVQIKESEISRFEADRRTFSWRQFANSASLSEMANLDIRKTRCALLEDLQEVENELQRRCTKSQDRIMHKEDGPGSKETWKHDKELVECTNEQLKTVQVPAGRETNEEQEDDEIYKRIISQTFGSFEKIQQLIVELAPYQQERLTLIEKINDLSESLEEARNRANESQRVKEKAEREECVRVISLSDKINEMMDHQRDHEKARLDEQELNEKIDEALAIHVKRSIERVDMISHTLEGAGDNVTKEIAKKEKKLKARNEEIAKLKIQVACRVSRGQGDHAMEQEHANEMGRVKKELLSSYFKLKGANQRIKNLGADVNRLTKENKSLNNTVHITNDLVIKVDEMEIRLNSLQVENSELRQRVARANELCADYRNKLLDFRDEGMRAKQALDRAETKMQSLLLARDNKIDTLQGEKEKVERELEESNLKVAALTEQIQTLRIQNKNLDFLEDVIREILKLDKNAKRLRVNIKDMKSLLENQQRSNDKIEEDLNLILGENDTLQSETKKLCDYIKENTSNSAIAEAVAKQNEIDELRAKSLEDASAIENLQRDIDSLNKKAAGQEKAILVLEKTNADLRSRMEEIHVEKSKLGVANKEIIAKTVQLENEIREKDKRIEKLAREVEATKDECKVLSEKVQLLTHEKTELSEKIKSETASWQTKMTELQQQYKRAVRALHDQHNVSIKKLEAQYEEDLKNNENPFDPETWLRSLTAKEIAELHKRICKLTPCDAPIITRGLNDKQNQQLQEDGKLIYSDIVNLKTGHHKKTAVGHPRYMYARRKFDEPIDTPIKDNATVDMQRINFIHQCAMEHNQDSGN